MSVIVGGELFTDCSDHPRKLVTLNPKLKSTGAGRCNFFPVGGMPTASSLAWKTSLRRIRTLWHCSRLRSVALYLWLIVVISVRQSTVAAISGALPGAGYGQFEHKADSLIAKFKEAGGTVRDWCMSRVTAIISALVICIIVCLSWAVNHYRDNHYLRPARQMPENWSWRTQQYWHADASMMLLRSMQNTRRS